MTIYLHKNRATHASILVVTMLVCGILGIIMASYLGMVKTQQYSVARAQSWNQSLVVAEAGVEDALAFLNATGASTNNGYLANVTNAPWIQRLDLGAGIYSASNSLPDTNGYYLTYIKIPPALEATNGYPVVVSTGFVSAPFSLGTLSRAVRVYTKARAPITAALVIMDSLNMNGNNVGSDSFDSYGTNAWSLGARNANGDIYALNTNTLSIGNGNVRGVVHTQGGNVTVGSSGVIGDETYVDSGTNNGTIQLGHVVADADVTIADNVLPPGIPLPRSPNPATINGVTYKYVLNNASIWKLASIDGNVYVNSPGVKLYVTGDASGNGINLGSSGVIKIPAGKSLDIYMGAQNATLSGSAAANDTGVAANFRYFGLPSNTSITFNGNANFTGQIIAPEAALTMNGSGNSSFDITGSTIVKSVTFNGNFNYHFDEALLRANAGYKPISWDEL
jgi:hypothetical protein